jgi:hypothetical protein
VRRWDTRFLSTQVLYDPYYSDGYLLEAAAALAAASQSRPEGRRVHPGVAVIVNSALSAEAHLNYAIYRAFEGEADRNRLTALELRSKLLYVPKLVTGKSVFDPGAAPLGDLFALVDMRNKLVHPRPPRWKIDRSGSGGMTIAWPGTDYPLDRAAVSLSSLCRYLDMLESAAPELWKEQAWIARQLLVQDGAFRKWDPALHRRALQDLVEHLTTHLPEE